MSCLGKLNRVYNALQDEESRELFEARLSYVFDRNQNLYEDKIHQRYSDWRCPEIDDCLAKIESDGIVLFGCGHDGKIMKEQLSGWGYRVNAFCDNDSRKWGGVYEEVDIISPEDLIQKYKSSVVVIASSAYGKEIYEQLKGLKFPLEQVIMPQYKTLVALRGCQYFDIFEPKEQELYIDCGGFDGETVFDFCKWTNEHYQEIYVMEPMKAMSELIEARCKNADVKDISVISGAAWNKKEKLYFDDWGAGSCQSDSGKIGVDGIDIDSFAKEKKVTLIKMDIEGSELKALEGAKETIRKNQPRLAICIYHKAEDIYEIGNYLLWLVPEYKFKIRHYASNMWETVLYAEV